jgi:hypothetical protein
MRLSGILIFGVALVGVSMTANAGTVVLDQEFDPGSSPSSYVSFGMSCAAAQTFTVGTAGTLDHVEVYLAEADFVLSPYDVEFKLFELDATNFTATNRGSFTIPGSSLLLGNYSWIGVDLSSLGVSVAAGDIYALYLDGLNFKWATGDAYDHGTLFQIEMIFGWQNQYTDAGFRTYVETPGSTVPLPSAALMGLGLMGLLGLARRFRR